jgi:2,4-dienoyl-CoA reductase-like NADH-dependent reductase (Old Yellow Enzyme family)
VLRASASIQACASAQNQAATMSAVNADLLFQPIKIGGKDLKHRIVYAPLTR